MLVGKQAPDFTANAVLPDNTIGELTLSKYRGNYAVLFFYPLDFTFVCPSEIIAFDKKVKEFEERNTKLISVSVDSEFSHFAWKMTEQKNGGIGNVQFPMVADITKNISRDYEVLADEAVAYRGLYLIDKEGVVRHQLINDMPLGRNVDEALRMVDALQFFEANGEVCPANWNKGKSGMKADAEGVADYLANHNEDL